MQTLVVGIILMIAACGQLKSPVTSSGRVHPGRVLHGHRRLPWVVKTARGRHHAIRYTVSVVDPDRGCSLPDWAVQLSPLAPSDIALAANGDLAFVEHGPAQKCGVTDRVITTGTETIISTGKTYTTNETVGLPYGVVMEKTRGARRTIRSLPRLKDRHVTQEKFVISGLRLTSDGTPFITLATGTTIKYEWVFVWGGSTWRPVDTPLPQRYGGPRNTTIGAAQTPSQFGVNGDFFDQDRFDYGTHERDPTYFADEASLVENGRILPLGLGDVTAMRGPFSTGYAAPYGWCAQVGAPVAVRWTGSDRKTLGSGVAYGVDSNGDVVGDDRVPEGRRARNDTQTGCIENAHPTIWRRRQKIRITELRGSALAIRNGTVVGTAGLQLFGPVRRNDVVIAIRGGRAFITKATDAVGRFRFLDDLVPNDWSITSAFAIADSGRILAVGHGLGSSTTRILVLDPVAGIPRGLR